MGDGQPEARRRVPRARQGRRAQGLPQGQGAAPGARAGLRPARQRRGRVRARARVVLPREPGAQPRRGRRAARRGGGPDQEGPAVHVRRDHRGPRRGRAAGLQGPRRSSAASWTIAETAVDEALAQLRREHTELRPIEGREVTAAGDIVGLSVTGTIGEHQINQPQFAVDLDDDEREPLPGHAPGADRHPARHQGQAARDPGPRGLQGRVDPRPQGRADRDDPRGAREGRPRARRRVREGHRQGRHARRPARRAPQGARGPRDTR